MSIVNFIIIMFYLKIVGWQSGVNSTNLDSVCKETLTISVTKQILAESISCINIYLHFCVRMLSTYW